VEASTCCEWPLRVNYQISVISSNKFTVGAMKAGQNFLENKAWTEMSEKNHHVNVIF